MKENNVLGWIYLSCGFLNSITMAVADHDGAVILAGVLMVACFVMAFHFFSKIGG